MNKTQSKQRFVRTLCVSLSLLFSPMATYATDGLTSLILPSKADTAKSNSTDKPSDTEVHGYVKADFVYDIGIRGSDVLSYQAIPMDSAGASEGHLFFHIKQTRFNVSKTIETPLGPVKGFIEGDFLSGDGNQNLTNSSHFRIRHAYVKVGNWLAGQAWSSFVDTKSYPETVEFGNLTAQSLLRQSRLTYTKSADDYQFIVSFENPEADVRNPYGYATTPSNSAAVAVHDRYPDIILRSIVNKPWGHLSMQYVHRDLSLDVTQNGQTRRVSTIGHGLGVTGRIKTSALNDLRFYFVSGQGIGRYIQESTGVAADLFQSQDGSGEITLQTNKSYGGYLSYRHWWNESWRSNAGFGFVQLQSPSDNAFNVRAVTVDKSYHSAFVNAWWQPTKAFSVGVEYLRGVRETQNADFSVESGDLERFMVSFKYAF